MDEQEGRRPGNVIAQGQRRRSAALGFTGRTIQPCKGEIATCVRFDCALAGLCSSLRRDPGLSRYIGMPRFPWAITSADLRPSTHSRTLGLRLFAAHGSATDCWFQTWKISNSMTQFWSCRRTKKDAARPMRGISSFFGSAGSVVSGICAMNQPQPSLFGG